MRSFAYICAYDFTFSNMDNIQRQRGNIEPHKEQKADGDHIRTEYAGNGEIPLLPSQDTGVEIAGNDSACIAAIPFKLSDFYDRYSPHAHIDHSRAYVRHPQPKREHRLPKGYPELMKELPRYFREYRPKKWLFEGETPGPVLGKRIGESAEKSHTTGRYQAPGTRTQPPPLLCHASLETRDRLTHDTGERAQS